MSRAPAPRRRRLAALALAALTLAACAAPPPAASLRFEAEDDRAEFMDDLQSDIARLDALLEKTRAGINLSDFSLGWFVLTLLSQLGGHDPGLYARLHPGDQSVEGYLRTRFSAAPETEIAAIRASAEAGPASLRLAAAQALEVLTGIPDPDSPPDAQAASRARLDQRLVELRAFLGGVQETVAAAPVKATPPPHD